MSNDISKTLKERGKRYGVFMGHAVITQGLKRQFQSMPKWAELKDDQREALDMIAHKIGRIFNGDPNYDDSWVDIAGYAKLVGDRLTEEASLVGEITESPTRPEIPRKTQAELDALIEEGRQIMASAAEQLGLTQGNLGFGGPSKKEVKRLVKQMRKEQGAPSPFPLPDKGTVESLTKKAGTPQTEEKADIYKLTTMICNCPKCGLVRKANGWPDTELLPHDKLPMVIIAMDAMEAAGELTYARLGEVVAQVRSGDAEKNGGINLST